MSTNGTKTYKPTEYVPTSPAVNNWVYIKIKEGRVFLWQMTIFDYRELRNKLVNRYTQEEISGKIVAMGLIKPKDETKYLEINPNDSALKAYLKQRENES